MDRCSNSCQSSQGREKVRRERVRRERVNIERRARCCRKSRLAKAAGAQTSGRMREHYTPLWREAHLPLLEVEMFEKQKCEKLTVSDHFSKLGCGFAGQAFSTLPKVSKTRGFCSNCKNDARLGTFEEGLERCI